MKRLVSFSLFVTIVLLALIARNTAHAQRVLPVVRITPVISVGPGYVVVKPATVFKPRYHRHARHGVECYKRIRIRKYS